MKTYVNITDDENKSRVEVSEIAGKKRILIASDNTSFGQPGWYSGIIVNPNIRVVGHLIEGLLLAFPDAAQHIRTCREHKALSEALRRTAGGGQSFVDEVLRNAHK